jgi:hypothetical protein
MAVTFAKGTNIGANNLRVKFRCISAYNLISYLSWYYLCISFIFCTYWVPTISVLNLAIFSFHSNLLLRRRRWTGILWWGVLGCALPRLLFLWCFRVFRCSVSLESWLVFKDILYVTYILYSWHLVICEHFLSVCVEQLILGIHTMGTWFYCKIGCDWNGTRAVSTVGTLA